MKETVSTDRSRIVATAKSLGNLAPDSHCFTSKAVLLTAERHVLDTENGRDCFLNCFRLLIRMVTHLTVQVPKGSPVLQDLVLESDRISHHTRPAITSESGIDMTPFDAIISIGTQSCGDLPWTVVNSNGWIARVSSCGQNLPAEIGQPNPVGALAAACLGVAEVFKRLIALRPERGELLRATSFSFYSYCECDNPGPPLPATIPLDFALVGLGAIGNGIVHLLDRLPVSGRLTLLDYQQLAPENWGTYILVGPGDFNVPKVRWAEQILQAKLAIVPKECKIDAFVGECIQSQSYPRIVVNALDNVPARRSVQTLWPDYIIDGAIGPTACEVTVHPWLGDYSCLLCDFEEPAKQAEEIQLSASGLRPERLKHPESDITQEDVAAAPADKREWLQTQIGKRLCSVVSEAVLADLSNEDHHAGFAPSAPFVACLSSCMVVTELIRYALGWPTALETGYQFDSLVGPANGIPKNHGRKRTCVCVTRKTNIDLFRAARHAP